VPSVAWIWSAASIGACSFVPMGAIRGAQAPSASKHIPIAQETRRVLCRTLLARGIAGEICLASIMRE